MNVRDVDVVIVGSGAGGGTVAQALADAARSGLRILLLEQGAHLDEHEFTGNEVEMANALYADGGGFLNSQGTITFAFGRTYGGSTVVYTGTTLTPPERVIREWNVPGLTPGDVSARARRYIEENRAHTLAPDKINQNNELFVQGCAALGLEAEQFPINVDGCRGSGLCNLGCPNSAKMGTHRVQLPRAQAAGVEVVTRARVTQLGERWLDVEVSEKRTGDKGRPSEWAPGHYRIKAGIVVLAGSSAGTVPLLLRSALAPSLPRLGEGFTCHPALIIVGEHDQPITNMTGHPKSFFLDRAEDDHYVLETCMYYPFITAKNLTGFGADHSSMMRAFPRLQMILALACDKATAGNRITVDKAGDLVIDYTLTQQSIDAMTNAARLSAKILFAAGARRVNVPATAEPWIDAAQAAGIDTLVASPHFLPGRVSVSAAHLMGGCAMGASAGDSVCDSWGRVHGAPWLRVADASLFPNSVEVNPYLTVMALADRVAEAVVRDLPMRATTPSQSEEATLAPA